MLICYVDEAGCPGRLPGMESDVQPALVIVGVALQQREIPDLTRDYLDLKRTFFPGLLKSKFALDAVRAEIKGSDLRKNLTSGDKQLRRQSNGFVDKTIRLLERYDAKIFGCLSVKEPGAPFDGKAVYARSVQDICQSFQFYLSHKVDLGFVIADSRTKDANANVSHSVFTQMFRHAGNPYTRLLEMPTFGHSDNHVGLQLADLVCSGLLFPMAMATYFSELKSCHVRTGYETLKVNFGERLQRMQYRYQEPATGKWRGGIALKDAIRRRRGGALFRPGDQGIYDDSATTSNMSPMTQKPVS